MTALESGLWAVLFCVLLLYQLRDGRAREAKFTQTVDVLLERLAVLNCVADDVKQAIALLKRRESKKRETPPSDDGAARQVQGV